MEKGEIGSCPFRYQGQYEDTETGLYYNRFRYYAVEEGVYISRDPIRIKGGRKIFAYVKDTNIWVDPLGLTYAGKKRGPKTKDEGGPHNEKIGDVAKKLQDKGWKITEGGNVMPEKLHRIPGADKDRRPDIVAERDGRTIAVNVGKRQADGQPVARERDAKKDLQKEFGDGNVYFVPYN